MRYQIRFFDPEDPSKPLFFMRCVGHLILFVHQVHHRGQVHDLLSQTAVAPPQLDEFFLSQDASRRSAEMQTLSLAKRTQ